MFASTVPLLQVEGFQVLDQVPSGWKMVEKSMLKMLNVVSSGQFEGKDIDCIIFISVLFFEMFIFLCSVFFVWWQLVYRLAPSSMEKVRRRLGWLLTQSQPSQMSVLLGCFRDGLNVFSKVFWGCDSHGVHFDSTIWWLFSRSVHYVWWSFWRPGQTAVWRNLGETVATFDIHCCFKEFSCECWDVWTFFFQQWMYTSEISDRCQKWPYLNGVTFSNPSFWVSSR